MLTKLSIRNFKSLGDVSVDLPRLAVLYGPNAAGKSNFLEAIQALGLLGNSRTLSEATEAFGYLSPIRGYFFEAFAFPSGGLPELVRQSKARFTLEADLATESGDLRYRIEPEIDLNSSQLKVADEFLAKLTAKGEPSQNPRPAIERANERFLIRQARGHHPRHRDIGLNHSILSDRSLGGDSFPWLQQVREELWNWRTYSLEPRHAMRNPKFQAPADVVDVGIQGGSILQFLYKIKAMKPKSFEQVRRTLRTIVPAVESLDVSLDERRGLIDLAVRQDGVDYSYRVVSDGMMRVLALCAIVMNPWLKENSLLTFEEPENGVDPTQLNLIAKLFLSVTRLGGHQAIVTTHSPSFCDAILEEIAEEPDRATNIGLFNVRRERQETVVDRLSLDSPLFTDQEISEKLTGSSGAGLFQSLLLRGHV